MDKAWRSQLVFYRLSRKEDLCLLITCCVRSKTAFLATCFHLNLSGLWQSRPCYSHLRDEAAEA